MSYYHSATSAAPLLPTFFWGGPGDTKIHTKFIKTHVGSQVRESVASKWPRGAKGTPRWSKGAPKCAKNTSRGPPGTPFWHLGLQMCTFAKHQYLLCFSHISTPGGLLLGTPGTQSSTHAAQRAKMDAQVMPHVPRGAPRERPGWPPRRKGCQKVSKKVTKNDLK